jgi:hypothetical protein
LELGQGGIFIHDKPQLFKASLQTHFNLGIDPQRKFRIGPTGALQYFSPDLEAMGGGRVSYLFWETLNIGGASAGLHVAAEGLVGTGKRKTVGGALIADGFGVLQLTARVAQEVKGDVTFFELAVGADLLAWFGGSSKSNRTPQPVTHPGYFDLVALNMSVEASWLLEPEFSGELEKSKRLIRQAQNLPDTTALISLLENNDLARLASNVRSSIDGANLRAQMENMNISGMNGPNNRKRLVKAIIEGWHEAMPGQ